MKTSITLSAKKLANTDYSPQLLFFLNGVLLDEQIIASQIDSKSYELDADFEEGWNTFSIFVGDTGWSTDYGPAWEIDVQSLTVDGEDTFPISRGEGLKPFMLAFNAANIVVETQNTEGLLATPNYVQLCDKTISGDCSFGFCFKVENGKIVDHYYDGVDRVDAWDTLNVSRLPFIKFVRLALRDQADNLEDYISICGESTAEKYWRLPVIIREIPRLESLVDYCAKKPWARTTIYRDHDNKNLPTNLILELLSPIE